MTSNGHIKKSRVANERRQIKFVPGTPGGVEPLPGRERRAGRRVKRHSPQLISISQPSEAINEQSAIDAQRGVQ
jgi:hypothetical protein